MHSSSDTTGKDADRGSDQRLYLVGQDRLETGSLERYSGLQDFPTQTRGLIPEIPRHGEVQDVVVLRVDLSADGNDFSIGLY